MRKIPKLGTMVDRPTGYRKLRVFSHSSPTPYRSALRHMYASTVALSVMALAAYAQTETEAPLPESPPATAGAEVQGLDELYRQTEIRSQVARQDPPLTTRFTLNRQVIGPDSQRSARVGLLFGSGRSIEPDAFALIPFDTSIDSSIVDGVGVRRQTGWYAQLQMVDRSRQVEWRRQTPVELIGVDIDLSVTGGCLPGAPAGAVCTFTPGVTVGENDIDPETLLPGRFIFDSEFGQRIDPRTQQALIDAEGFFVRGDPDLNERVGMSLRLPNTGQVLDDARMPLSGASRTETIRRRPIFTLSKVERTLRSNDVAASLSHTTRSIVLLEPKEWDAYTLGAQFAALVLPSLHGSLPAGQGGAPRGDISNNLFLASNNLRIPQGGFTMFQTGTGRVAHPETRPRNPDETPTAFFNSIWLGVSPVRTTVQSTNRRYSVTGERVFDPDQRFYYEGGTGDPLQDITGRITIIDDIARDISSLELQNIGDLFVQVGLGVSRQSALEELITQQRSRFRYVPHLSFTGNRTDGRSVVRYFMGVLNPRDANFYLGADATYQAANGFRFSASAVGYTNPDPDHFSNIELSIARSFQAGNGGIMTLGVAGALEFDRPALIAESAGTQNQNDRIDLFGQYQADWGRVTGRLRATGLRNGTTRRSATLGASLPVFDRSQMSLQVTPVSNEDAFIQAQIGLAAPISERANSPVFRAQYARMRYNFGNDAFGRNQSASEDTFRASMQFEF